MDAVQRLLFGEFPRRVGTPAQHWVFNAAQFDLFVDAVSGARNAYSTLGRLDVQHGQIVREVADKVVFDLDSPAKADEGEPGDWSIFDGDASAEPSAAEVADLMRSDPDIRDQILGQPCEDARRLVRQSQSDGIPVVGVFTGFGLHVHQLYQPTADPQVAMTTISAKYADEAALETMDWEVIGQVERLVRVPNIERRNVVTEGRTIVDGAGTALWQVPLDADELREITPRRLLVLAEGPRDLETYQVHLDDRPQMPVWEEYRDEQNDTADVPQRPVDRRTAAFDDAGIEDLLSDLLSMPCMVERIMQPNPEHAVRVNSAVLLFNAGLKPHQVCDLFSRLGWVDFDRETTRDYLNGIYKAGYSDMSCSTIREKRLCTRADEPEACPTYQWSGGEVEWQ